MYNFLTKEPYRGNNAQVLASSGWTNPYFMTFKQARMLGRTVKKGSKGITLMRVVKVQEEVAFGTRRTFTKPKYFTVFNVDQTEEFVKKNG